MKFSENKDPFIRHVSQIHRTRLMLFILFIGVMVVVGVMGAFCWPYTVNYWLVFFDREPGMLWWHGVLMGYVPAIGQLVLPIAVLTWIFSLFI